MKTSLKRIDKYGLKVHVRPQRFFLNDWAHFNEVFTDDTYLLRKFVPFLRYNPTQNYTFVDVGGHIGSFAILAKTLLPKVKMIAVEPCLSSYEIYLRNMRDNNIEHVAYHKAMTYVKDVIYLTSNVHFAGRAITDQDKEGYEKVEPITLEDIIQENKLDRIDLMKMDCEGSEWNIISNAQPESLAKVNAIVGEYHGLTRRETLSFLRQYFPGMKIYGYNTFFDSMYKLGTFWGYRACIFNI